MFGLLQDLQKTNPRGKMLQLSHLSVLIHEQAVKKHLRFNALTLVFESWPALGGAASYARRSTRISIVSCARGCRRLPKVILLSHGGFQHQHAHNNVDIKELGEVCEQSGLVYAGTAASGRLET